MSSSPSGYDARRRTVTSTVPSEELAGLDLHQLRSYRGGLAAAGDKVPYWRRPGGGRVDRVGRSRGGLEAEEDKVSYWRRLVHARTDVLTAESDTGNPLSIEDLVRVLGDTGSGQTRRALVRFRAADPLPDLPVLSEMWVTEVDPHDAAQV